jgi:GH25 family lysozyme M1 (1,4-beta-N-acetylmuramidase)
VTGTTSFFADCASYQGVPVWAKTAAVCVGGAEKVTEGTGYANPDWPASKAGLKLATAHGFVPLAYLFLDPGASGADQARYFASKAGDLTGFGIAIDFERSAGGSPTLAQAQQCAAEVRALYPGHPVGGYCPHWYTGGEDLSFCDWLWASSYVNGSGDPGMLYSQVPASWWAPYGDRSPLLLQFTATAVIAGISGTVDCSAFQGTQAQLRSHLLPAPPKPAPPKPAPAPAQSPAKPGDGSMLITLAPGQVPVTFPVWADAASYKEPAAYSSCSLIVTGGTGAVVKVTAYPTSGALAAESATFQVATGQPHVFVPREPWSHYGVIAVQRLDSKPSVPASATYRTW